ncbi:MAG: ECF transporter S component [Oscillospiraceae bacterium]|nr:ECF transporter S component [Oscillospiraceae bacterium]
MENKRFNIRRITGLAMMTVIVVLLQFLGAFIRFGPFSISLVLIPIVVGAALYGVIAGAWLGFVFGMVVLLSGDAAAFLVISPAGTILVVLLKGILSGLCAGAVYKALRRVDAQILLKVKGREKWGVELGVIVSAIVAPVVNTGIFLLGCLVFFLPTIREWGLSMGFESVGKYMILGLVGGNFLFELLFNIVLSPVIVRLIRIGSRQKE